MMKLQEEIAEFNLKRGWEKDTKYIKDFLLNLCEEATEAWSLIKWLDEEKQKEILKKHKNEYEDFVGDTLFIILKIAWLLDIDSEKSLRNTLDEYEKRFPVDAIQKVKHGNPLAGGVDNKI